MARPKKMSNAAFARGISWALRLVEQADVSPEKVARLRAELRRRYRQRRPLVGPQYKFRVAAVEATHRGMVVTFKEVSR